MKRQLIAVALAGGLAACAATSTLYPVNDQAKALGVLHATFMRTGTGAGEATMTLPDGDVLKGEYRVVDSATYGSGVGFVGLHAPGQTPAAASVMTSTAQIPGANNFIAEMYGGHGTSVECQGFTNTMTGHGSGLCKFSTGEEFREMH